MRAVPMRRGELRVDEVPDPVPRPGEVLVKTLACGICGSDLHMVQRVQRSLAGNDDGSPDFRFDNDSDVIMGHEFCADCEETLPIGQRVVSVPGVPRGDARISLAYGNELPGGYSERMVLSEALMIPVPDNVTTEEAAMTEPMAVGRHGVEMSRLEDMPADTVPVVIGCGPVGLSVIADLRRRGIERIVAADFSAKRRELASTMGAANVVDPNDVPTFDAWRAEVGTTAGAADEPSALESDRHVSSDIVERDRLDADEGQRRDRDGHRRDTIDVVRVDREVIAGCRSSGRESTTSVRADDQRRRCRRRSWNRRTSYSGTQKGSNVADRGRDRHRYGGDRRPRRVSNCHVYDSRNTGR